MLRSSSKSHRLLLTSFFLRSSSLSSSSLPADSTADATDPSHEAPTEASVLYVLKTLDKKPEKALSFLNRANEHYNFRPGPAACNLMLRILGRRDHLKEFWSFLHSMDSSGVAIEQGTYLTLLSAFKAQKLSAEHKALAQFYKQAGERARWQDNAVTVVEAVMEDKLESLDMPLSEDLVVIVLRDLRDSPEKALDFFRWAGLRPGYEHGSVAYNALARVLARDECSIGEFWILVQEMKEKGHDMDIDTYVKISRHFQNSRMIKEAVELYEFMMDGPYKPALHDCGVLLRRISLSGTPDLDLVWRVVRKYEAAGFSLTKVVYDGIHRSLTSVGHFDEAEEILKKMKEEGLVLDNITYSQLVYGLCKAERFDDARKVLDEMEKCGCIPDVKTWTVLIQGHCSAGKVDQALECLTEMLEKGCNADADVVDVLVKGLCGKNKAGGAYTLLVEMAERGRVRPWQATYKHLIQELLRRNKLEEGLELLRMMKKHNFPPFADPFPPFISKYGTVEDAQEFLKALTVNNYPSPAAYLKVFKPFFDESRYSEAQDLLFKCPYHIRKHADVCKLFGSI